METIKLTPETKTLKGSTIKSKVSQILNLLVNDTEQIDVSKLNTEKDFILQLENEHSSITLHFNVK